MASLPFFIRNSISDSVNIRGPEEVAGFRLGEAAEPVSEAALPEGFEFFAIAALSAFVRWGSTPPRPILTFAPARASRGPGRHELPRRVA